LKGSNTSFSEGSIQGDMSFVEGRIDPEADAPLSTDPAGADPESAVKREA